MAKKSAIFKNEKRKRMVKKYASKRAKLKAIIYNKDLPIEDRFRATLQLAKMPTNSSKIRVQNRCQLTGRPHAYYRKLGVSRIALRDLASRGELPGVTKSSW